MDNAPDTFTPGFYPNIPENNYHNGIFGPAGGSLSSTEAARILKSPGLYKWHKEHPEQPNTAFDLGHVAHALILGRGLDIHVHDHDSLRTKAAKEEVAAARAEGKVPVSRAQYEQMKALADSVLTHPTAAALLENGEPEVSVYDTLNGVWARGRLDWYTEIDGCPTIVDIKTTTSANPDDFTRAVINYDYDLQAAWYSTIVEQLTGETPDFIHVVVEKTEPHMVSVIRLGMDSDSPGFFATGFSKGMRAIDIYKKCLETGQWPTSRTAATAIYPPDWYVNEQYYRAYTPWQAELEPAA